MPELIFTTTAAGWPLLDKDNFVAAMPDWARRVAFKLEAGEAAIPRAENAATRAEAAALQAVGLAGASADRSAFTTPGGGVNIVSGSPHNSVTNGTANVVAGGGTTGNPNVITGGNTAGTSGAYRVLAGGYDNRIDSTGVGADTISGGAHHRISNAATHGTISGGSYNKVLAGDYSSIGGGTNNTANASGVAIAGGRLNTAAGQDSVIGGGINNSTAGQNAVVSGGINNAAPGVGATIGGGNGNQSRGRNSYIGSGDGNQVGKDGTAHGDYAYLGGGFRNEMGTITSARYSAIPAGRECTIQHEYSLASGYKAATTQAGTEVRASGAFATAGDAQVERLVLRQATTDAAAKTMGWNGLSSAPVMPVNSTFMVEATVVARRTDTPGSNAAWKFTGLFVRDPGAARVINATAVSLGAEGYGTDWGASLTAGATSINLRVVGADGQTIRWVAQLTVTEVAG